LALFLGATLNVFLAFVAGAVFIAARAGGRSPYLESGIAVLCWLFLDLCLYRLSCVRDAAAEQEQAHQEYRQEYYVVAVRGHCPTPAEKTAAVREDEAGSVADKPPRP